MTVSTIRRAMLSLAPVLMLAACGDSREDARAELHRLHTELDRHSATYGRYPQTIEAARPASADNLPFSPENGVVVQLRHAGADGLNAVARKSPWICVMTVDARKREQIECTPLSNASQDVPPAPDGTAGGALTTGASADSSAAAQPAGSAAPGDSARP